MSHLLAQGCQLTVIVLTQGEHCYPAEIIPTEEQKRQRRRLLLSANKQIGLPEAAIHVLAFTDSNIHREDPEKEHLRRLLDTLHPKVIFIPYEKDTSIDHQHAHHIVRELVGNSPIQLYEFCVWFWCNTKFKEMRQAPWKRARYFRMSRTEQTLKRTMLDIYTKSCTPEGIPYSGSFPPGMIATALWRTELFFEIPTNKQGDE